MRPETEAAIRAAGIASRIADSRAGADLVTSKGGIDLVTATDVACEDAIRRELTLAFPEYPVIGEERGGEPVAGRPYWLVDPICGTRPFASNVPLYCTNIALVEDGAVTLAAVAIGKTGEILFAEKNGGARMRVADAEHPIAVGDRSNTIWIDGKTEHGAGVVRRALLLKRWYVWQFSSTIAYAYVACGRMAGVIQFGNAHPYGSVHTAAGRFVAAEAGAVVTDLETGGPWQLTTRSFLMAATPELHRELSDLVKSVS